MKLLLIAAVTLWRAHAQSTPAFDVASVKAIPYDARTFNGMRHTTTPTSIAMLHVSLGYIVRFAYDIPVQRGAIGEEIALVLGLREQLGLALRPGRDLTDTLVVDRVQKVPSGN